VNVIPLSDTDNWIGLELRHIVALDAVARAGTFSQAAVELGYTPNRPSVSRSPGWNGSSASG